MFRLSERFIKLKKKISLECSFEKEHRMSKLDVETNYYWRTITQKYEILHMKSFWERGMTALNNGYELPDTTKI